jgi:hypothetical protein
MKKPKKILLLITYLVLLVLTGCGSGKGTDIPTIEIPVEKDTQVSSESTEDQELYLITALRSSEETIQLYRYRNGKEYRFSYSMDTVFHDKYGNYSTVSAFYPGKVVYIGNVDDDGRLSEVTAADAVWQYDAISRFSVDEEGGILRIADSNYRITSETMVFSDDEIVDFSAITENDVLSVIGQEKNILSVRITTGHGTLALLNTELFEGSYLQLGTNIFAEITPEMTLELPEGEYLLAVANNGWGGNCEIQVTRGETVEVDLDEIKGDGPSYGTIRFVFDVEDVTLAIDGTTIDYSEPVTLQYGRHSLVASCDGYDDLSKTLIVNSGEATIAVNFNETTDTITTDSGTETDSETDTDSETSTDSETGTDSETSTDSETNADSGTDTDADTGDSTTSGTDADTTTGTDTDAATGNDAASDAGTGSDSTSTTEDTIQSDSETISEDDILNDYLSTLTELIGSL